MGVWLRRSKAVFAYRMQDYPTAFLCRMHCRVLKSNINIGPRQKIIRTAGCPPEKYLLEHHHEPREGHE